MRVKRFLAPDMRQALRMVHEDQGPDAVVLSSRRSAAGIELLVALEYDEQLVSAMGTTAVSARTDPPSTPAGPPQAVRGASREDAIETIGGELRRLRAALESQLRWLEGRDGDPTPSADVLEWADRLGLGRPLAEELIAEARAQGHPSDRLWPGVRAALSARIPTVAEDLVNKGGVFALIGPTGVGKTTTVAKLATRFALRYGRRHVALITTDTYRIGAREQLLTFGEVLGIPVDFAASRDELGALLQQHAHKRLVLIDNAGLSQRDLRLAAQLSDLARIPLIKSYLVVSCGTASVGLDEVFREFGRTRLQGCIVTKLDEAVSLGPVLGALVRHGVPLVYACDGQRVPEDIHPAPSLDLVEWAETLACESGQTVSQPASFMEYKAANGFV